MRGKSENEKTVPKKKENSRQNTKGDNTQKKDSQSENEKKQGVGSNSTKTDVRDTVGTDELERKQKEAEEVKSVPAVAHDEGSRTRTRSSRNSVSVKNHDQTEKGLYYHQCSHKSILESFVLVGITQTESLIILHISCKNRI